MTFTTRILLILMPDLDELWYQLNRQPVDAFADWPNKEIPKGKPGVYLVYQGSKWTTLGCPSRICRAASTNMRVVAEAGILEDTRRRNKPER